MLRVRPGPPVDYSLCNQIVTLYHAELKDAFACTRTVFRGAFFDQKRVENVDKVGSRETNNFLLVLPSGWNGRLTWKQDYTLSVGDKVMLGEGPRITSREEWAAFVPAKVSGLVVVRDLDEKHWNGSVCHIEAGG